MAVKRERERGGVFAAGSIHKTIANIGASNQVIVILAKKECMTRLEPASEKQSL